MIVICPRVLWRGIKVCVDKKGPSYSVCDAFRNFSWAEQSAQQEFILLPQCRLYGVQSAYVCAYVCCVHMRDVLPRRVRRGRLPEGDMCMCTHVCLCVGNEQRKSSLLIMSTSSCRNLSKNVLLHGNQTTDNREKRRITSACVCVCVCFKNVSVLKDKW